MPKGLIHTVESKEKISVAAIRTMKQPNAGFRQIVVCDICGQKMSPANLGRHKKACEDISLLMDMYPRAFPERIPYKEYKSIVTRLRDDFGISIYQYGEMVEEQNGICAICKSELSYRLYVDHDHTTNKVRGLLCSKCNMMIGLAKDNESILDNAISYLRKYKD
jgi:hypothetical protein